MSYDIRIGVKVAGADDMYAVIGQPKISSPTYNIGTMFRKCMNWDFEQGEWYHLIDVLPNISHGLEELKFNREFYLQYNSPNGFGTVESAILTLESIIAYITDEFDGIRGSWNSCIPLDCLYIAW